MVQIHGHFGPWAQDPWLGYEGPWAYGRFGQWTLGFDIAGPDTKGPGSLPQNLSPWACHTRLPWPLLVPYLSRVAAVSSGRPTVLDWIRIVLIARIEFDQFGYLE